MVVEANQPQQENANQIYTYKAPWMIYAMGFQSKPSPQSRIAIGSMIEDIQNEVYYLLKLGSYPIIR